MQPSVGRIVHFQTYGTPGGEHPSEPIAAIITAVPEFLSDGPNTGPDGYVPAVHLFAIYSNGTSHKMDVPFAADPTPGHWNWPPRV